MQQHHQGDLIFLLGSRPPDPPGDNHNDTMNPNDNDDHDNDDNINNTILRARQLPVGVGEGAAVVSEQFYRFQRNAVRVLIN